MWVLGAVLLLGLAVRPEGAGPQAAPPRDSPVVSASAALVLLDTLAVKGRAPRTGYRRSAFGTPWADVDHNGCRTRDDVLARDLDDVRRRDRCVVVAGTLLDPYTHRSIAFRKSDAAAVQVDHVVALSDAWQKGAQQWTPARRQAFANDPLELLAVGAAVNDAKSDADAASWLPPYRPFRCAYVARQVQVKSRYGLWVTAAERDAIRRLLLSC
jgi:hypothetical protein